LLPIELIVYYNVDTILQVALRTYQVDLSAGIFLVSITSTLFFFLLVREFAPRQGNLRTAKGQNT
jgi:hypothetical protein